MKATGITARLLAVFVLASALPIAGVTALFLHLSSQALEASVLANLASIADKKADQIAAYLGERRLDAQSLAQLPQADALLRGRAQAPAADDAFRTFAVDKDYSDLLLIDSGGRIVYSAARAVPPGSSLDAVGGHQSELARGHAAAIAQLGPQVTDVRPFSPTDTRLAAFVVTPVVRNDRLLGTLALQLNLGRMMEVATDGTGTGSSGETVLAQRVGNEALYAVPLKHVADAAFRYRVPLKVTAAPMALALAGGRGQGVTRDYVGKAVVAAWRYLPDLRWGMVVKTDTDEAFAPIRHLQVLGLSALLLLLAGVGAITLALGRSIVAPIQQLTRVSQVIAAGETPVAVTVTGWREAALLADAFNHMTLAMHDVQANLERRVDERTHQLTESNAELEQFAYVASHDLQTPLRNMVSYAQLLERRYKDRIDADADEFIGFIIDNGRRMTQVIKDLLQYSRLTSQSEASRPVPAADAVALALSNLKLDLDETGAEVCVGELPRVMGDETHLVSLFQNLLGNALKYRAAERPPRLSVTAARVSPKLWRFAVADNGIGIEPQYHDKIFEIFQRLDPAAQRDGTGIGLTVCRRIVRRFGGTIWVDSHPGQGTTFFFTLGAAD